MSSRTLIARSRALLLLAAVGLGTTACSDSASPLAPEVTPSLARNGGKPGKPGTLPTRGHLIFSLSLANDYELYTANEDGSNLARLTYHAGLDVDPTYSPDGRRIAFVRAEPGSAAELWVMNADGTKPKQLTFFGVSTSEVGAPAWSPDGSRLAFHLRDGITGHADVYVIAAKGGTPTQLTTTDGFDGQPAWSPDGQWIAYASQGGLFIDPWEIWVMRPDGSEAHELVSVASTHLAVPAWSPDGTRLAYTAGETVRVRELATSWDVTVATQAGGADFSADGTMIVFTSLLQRVGVTTVAGGTPTWVSPEAPVATFDAEWSR